MSNVAPTLVVIALLVCSTACSSSTASEPAPPAGARGGGGPVPVTVEQAESRPMPLQLSAIGTGEPFSTVQVRSQVTGALNRVHFREGDDVQQGQVLFTLDRRPLEAALQQAEAALQRDIAQAASANSQAQRYRDLTERGITPRQQLEQARAAAQALDATVDLDRAAVENAKVQLQYATIVAPISGRTGALGVHEGSLVRANDTIPLVVINQVAPILESFAIPESRLGDLRRYMAQGTLRVEARPPGDEASEVGRISFVDNQVDQTTGTIRIKAVFPNKQHLLWPGQFADITLTLTTDPAAVTVPTAAVQTGQQGPYVFVVKDGKAELRAITVARTSGDRAIIAKGISPGEIVVTDGQLRIVPGGAVSVKDSGRSAQ